MARSRHRWMLLPWVVTAFPLAACAKLVHYNPTVWKMRLPSPDGQWIATAETDQYGGFGTAYIATFVTLQRKGTPGHAEVIDSFDCNGPVPHTYVLDNVANRGGTIDLQIRWVTPTHLLITYRSNPSIVLQVVKFSGIDITTRHLSGKIDPQKRDTPISR